MPIGRHIHASSTAASTEERKDSPPPTPDCEGRARLRLNPPPQIPNDVRGACMLKLAERADVPKGHDAPGRRRCSLGWRSRRHSRFLRARAFFKLGKFKADRVAWHPGEPAILFVMDAYQATNRTIHLAVLDRVLDIGNICNPDTPSLPSRVRGQSPVLHMALDDGRQPRTSTGTQSYVLAGPEPRLLSHTIVNRRALPSQLEHAKHGFTNIAGVSCAVNRDLAAIVAARQPAGAEASIGYPVMALASAHAHRDLTHAVSGIRRQHNA